MKRQFLTLLTIMALGLAAPLQAEDAESVTVPFEILRSKHLAVMIKVNGEGPYRVIFDTGAPTNLLSSKVAKEAKIKGSGAGAFPGLFGMQGQMKAESMEMGSVMATNMDVVVMDHPTIKAISRVLGPLEGIIGFPFFAKFRMTMDYKARTMTMTPVDYTPRDVMNSMMTTMLAPRQQAKRKVLIISTTWGFEIENKDKEDSDSGITIAKVAPGSAASEGGLKAGDRLLVLDGVWTDNYDDCRRAVSGVKSGRPVAATVERDGEELNLTITPRIGL